MGNPDKIYGGVPCSTWFNDTHESCGRPAGLRSVGLPGFKIPLCETCYELLKGLVIGGTK
jgi:hypothetical protein